jgi:phosphoglucosamine mutase
MIGDCPDGLNINKDSGSTKPERLSERVRVEKADVGFAYDGDADRLIAVDEKGALIDGDKMIYIFAKMLKAKKELRNNAVVATIMSNIGLRQGLSDLGVEMKTTSVGDRYVLEKMRKKNIILGGEQSGHIIFLDKNTTGDGIYASVKLLEAMSFYGRPLSELAGEVTIYPQVMANARVKNEKKKNFEKDAEILAEIEKIKKIHGDDGRVVIRPSGTEPLVRVMIEGENEAEIRKQAEFVAGLIEKKYSA